MKNQLKIGFIGVGKYGYSIMEAILKADYHKPENIFFEENDTKYLKELSEDKKEEIEDNYKKLQYLFKRQNCNAIYTKNKLSISSLLELLSNNKKGISVLILSLDNKRAERIFLDLKKNKENLKNLWLLSSISYLTAKEIRKKVEIPDLRIIRYVPNYASIVGEGIITAYSDSSDMEEREKLFRKVFYGIGKIYFVKNENDIDSARVITGSTIGLFAYFAKIVSEEIKSLNINGLGNVENEASKLVYHSIAGALALCKDMDWDAVVDTVMVTKGQKGEVGTTEFIVNALNEKNLPEIIRTTIRDCCENYITKKQVFEI